MEWGDVPAWVALVVAVVAAGFSGRALKHSSDSARAAQRSAESAERSATADEAALAEMRREAQERRDAQAEASCPRPELHVVKVADIRYILQNRGTGPAVNVTADAGQPGQCQNLPAGVTIDAGAGHEFFIVGAMTLATATEIYATWDGQVAPVALPVPQ
ncbi:hypothetical protein [Streptomyces sp. NPDC055085]